MNDILSGIKKAHDKNKIPALAYDRVSTAEQANTGLSLTHQQSNAQEYAERNDLYIVQTFSCVESAYKEGRKNFNHMLDLAIKYHIKHIIFKNPDRLGRNDVDWPRCKRLAKKNGFHIHLYELCKIFNGKSTAEDELFLDNVNAMGIYWSNKISQGVNYANLNKVKSGMAVTNYAPFGYKYDKANGVFVIDDETRDIVHMIFDQYDSEKMSLSAIANELNKKNIKTTRGGKWSKQSLHRMITNPFYAGYCVHKDNQYKGIHEAYIPLKRLNKMTKTISKPKGRKKFLFSGMIYNGDSGYLLSGMTTRGGHDSGDYVYYFATNGAKMSLSEQKIFDLIDAEIRSIKYNKDFAELLKQMFSLAVENKDRAQSKNKEQIAKEIARIEREQDALLDKLMSGIDPDAIKRRMESNRHAIERLESDRQEMRIDKDVFIFSVSDTIEEIRTIPRIWPTMSVQDRANFIKINIDRIEIYGDRIRIEWMQPLSFLLHPQLVEASRVQFSQIMGARRDDFKTLISRITDDYELWLAA